jgi:hypothetical protein
VAWERTLGDLLSNAGYACAAYGTWHVGEGPGRWPTDKGFAGWYGPPRSYEEALWPTDPFYDLQRDQVSHVLEIKHGEPEVTEREQLTLDVPGLALVSLHAPSAARRHAPLCRVPGSGRATVAPRGRSLPFCGEPHGRARERNRAPERL